MQLNINDLRNVPDFANTIADRNWHAWWTESGVSLPQYEQSIAQMTLGHGIPTAFVASHENQYVGSVLLIDNDLSARSQYAPWIAALWVEPKFRLQKVAARLIQATRSEAGRLGHETCYLCAKPSISPYYLAQGFQMQETNVEGLNIFNISTCF